MKIDFEGFIALIVGVGTILFIIVAAYYICCVPSVGY